MVLAIQDGGDMDVVPGSALPDRKGVDDPLESPDLARSEHVQDGQPRGGAFGIRWHAPRRLQGQYQAEAAPRASRISAAGRT